ncbi:MAG: class II aldolase/adducin family protein [Myxococcota bacterium]|nr:class II aldolase/adducin family protein [Myxococcota bacterium]
MTPPSERSLRTALVEAARAMQEAGHSPGTTGNVSARCEDGLLITPTGVEPDELEIEDVVALAPDGAPRPGQRAPSTEWPMHAAVYAARPDVGAAVHCHSRFATILSCTRRGIPAIHYMIGATGGFDVPCAPYATFGTRELSDHIVDSLGRRNACLMANHGQLALGRDVRRAIRTAEEVERLAETYWGVLAIGGPVLLTEDEMKDVVTRFLAGYGQPG